MQGSKGLKSQHEILYPGGPFDRRIRRTVAILIIASVSAMFIVQGCRGQLAQTGFSSPSSGVRFCSVIGSHSFQKKTMLKVAVVMGADDFSPSSSAPAGEGKEDSHVQ